MANHYFRFKQFTISQQHCSMKVTTDGCLFGAWAASLIKATPPAHVLDIGSGTGLLSIMLAQQLPAAQIDSIEIQKTDATECLKNAQNTPWNARIHCICGDALEYDFNKKYDAIICNSPFYKADLKGPNDAENTAHHEGALTLEKLLQRAKELLNNNGSIYLLYHYGRLQNVIGCLQKNGFAITNIVSVAHSAQHAPNRIMVAAALAEMPVNTATARINIYEDRQYTPAFAKLLKDFYLKL